MGIIFALLFDVVIAVVAYNVAKNRNRNEMGWAIGTFLLLPVILILLVLPAMSKTQKEYAGRHNRIECEKCGDQEHSWGMPSGDDWQKCPKCGASTRRIKAHPSFV